MKILGAKFLVFIIFCFYNSCKNQKSNKEIAFEIPSDTIISNFEIKGVSFVAGNKPINLSNISPLKKVNCNWIAQIPYAFCKNNDSQVTYSSSHQWWGETDQGIIETTKFANIQNINTFLKPQLWIGNSFTGAFQLDNDADWQLWENNYSNYILHFAKLADSLKIPMFCIGTELKLVVKNRPQYFKKLIKQVRQIYGGKLTYAANWDEYETVNFWDDLDYIGIDAYFPLSDAQTPTTNELIKKWQPIIKKIKLLSEKHNKKVIFTEIGYKSVDNCAQEPWNPQEKTVNIEAQSNCYQAFIAAFANEKWFSGAFLWKWYPNYEKAGGETNNDYTPQNKAVEKLLKKAF
jgi:hypothetical protein